MNEHLENLKQSAGNLAKRVSDMYQSFSQSGTMQQIKADFDQTGRLIQNGVNQLGDDINASRVGDNIKEASEHTVKSIEQAVGQLKSEVQSGELQQQIEAAGKDTVGTIRKAASDARDKLESGSAADAGMEAYRKMSQAVQDFRDKVGAFRE
jgi:hypothetical protein